MSRTKNFMYNSIASALYQVAIMIVGFILPKILLKYYGSEINGLVTSLTQFITYFSLVEAGLSGAAIYALYKPLADKDNKVISSIISATNKLYIKSGYIFIVLVLGLALLYPAFIKLDLLSPVLVGILILILGVKGALDFFTLGKYRALLSADQKVYVISLASIIYQLLNLIITYILARFGVNIVWVNLVAIIAIFSRSIILMVYVKVNYKFIDYKAKSDNKVLAKRWDVLFFQTLVAVQTGIPIVFATIFTNLKSVSVYSIFNMILNGINSILVIFTSSLSASFGDVIARKEEITLQRAYKEFEFMYYALITIIYSISFIMIMSFVNIYTKGIVDVDYNQPLLGFLFVLNGLLYTLKVPQAMIVTSAGLYKETRWQSTLQALIIIVFSIILTPFIGLAGILIASCLSNLYRDIDLLFFIPKNVTKLPVRDTFYRWVRIILSVVLILLPFNFISITANNYIEWVLNATVVGIYAIIVVGVISLIFEREELKNVFKRVKVLCKVK